MRWMGVLAFLATLISTGCSNIGESVRMGTFNVQFLPDSPDDKTRSKAIADRIKAGQYDVIALNEVFDEEARETFIAELKGTYPSYVGYIGDAAVGAQDSGLMLFSRFPFEPLPDGRYRHDPAYLQAVNSGSDWKDVAFIEYDEDSFPDNWAGKGVAFVRLKNPRTGRIYNIAFSHLQASYPEKEEDAEDWNEPIEIRTEQMSDVRNIIVRSLKTGQFEREDTFVLGDLNVDGDHADPNLGPDGFDQPNLWEWVEKFDQSGQFFAEQMKDAWAFEQSPHDRGLTNLYHWGPEFSPDQGARLDYVLRNRTTTGHLDKEGLCMQHMTLAHNMRDGAPFIESGFGFAGINELSDHIGLNADINLRAPQCDPLTALVNMTLDFWKTGSIAFPGSMQWYRFDTPGTYAFAVEGGAWFRVYSSRDMSTPAPQYFGETIEFKPYRGKPVKGAKFSLPEPPFFVRLSHPHRGSTGSYKFVAHRANCASKEEACVLEAGLPIQHTLPGVPINPDDTAWFELHTEKADSGNAQKLRFAVDQFAGESFELELRRDDGMTSVASAVPESDPDNPGMSRSVIEFEGADGQKLYLLVKRSSLAATGYRIGWDTNLTVLHGQGAGVPGAASENLFCVVETDGIMDTDEIYLTVTVDGIKKVDDLFIGQYDDGIYRTMEDLTGTVRYLDKVEVTLREEDGGLSGEDDFLSTTIGGLPAGKRQDLNTTSVLACCDGKYLLRYNRSRSLQK